MRVHLQPAYLLHSRSYRDSSLILEVITAEHGRMSLVARGARRRRRGGSQGSMLQPFVPLLLSFSGRSEMKNLVASEVAGAAPGLRGPRLFSALYLNELTVRLLHRHDPHPQLFAAYAEALSALAHDPDMHSALRRFELALLEELGYGFSLQADGDSGDPIRADARYHYQADAGLVACPPEPYAAGRRRLSYPGSHLLAMADGQVQGEVGQTAKHLLREAIASLLGPEPLRSRELFRAVAARGGDDGGRNPADGTSTTPEHSPEQGQPGRGP